MSNKLIEFIWLSRPRTSKHFVPTSRDRSGWTWRQTAKALVASKKAEFLKVGEKKPSKSHDENSSLGNIQASIAKKLQFFRWCAYAYRRCSASTRYGPAVKGQHVESINRNITIWTCTITWSGWKNINSVESISPASRPLCHKCYGHSVCVAVGILPVVFGGLSSFQ